MSLKIMSLIRFLSRQGLDLREDRAEMEIYSAFKAIIMVQILVTEWLSKTASKYTS